MTDLTLLEIQDKMRSKILLETPFISSELKDNILEAALDKALSSLDKYKPRIVKSMEPIANEDYKLLRAYKDDLDTNTQESFIFELGMNTATLYIYAAPWSIEQAYNNDRAVKKVFGDLVKHNAAMMMANVRRAASLNNLPFDLKGDQFYDEAKTSLESLEELLINTTRNTY